MYSGYAGPLSVVLAEVFWAISEVTSGGSYVAADSNLSSSLAPSAAGWRGSRRCRRAPT